VLVTALLVFILAVQKVELGSETLLYDDDVNENNEFASAWLDRADKTYYQDYDQDYVYYDEKVPSLYLPLKLLPLIVINIVLFLVLFVAAFATSTAVSGKRKRSVTPDNDCCETDITAYNDGSLYIFVLCSRYLQTCHLLNIGWTSGPLCCTKVLTSSVFSVQVYTADYLKNVVHSAIRYSRLDGVRLN
jgi:hypothetical protein